MEGFNKMAMFAVL